MALVDVDYFDIPPELQIQFHNDNQEIALLRRNLEGNSPGDLSYRLTWAFAGQEQILPVPFSGSIPDLEMDVDLQVTGDIFLRKSLLGSGCSSKVIGVIDQTSSNVKIVCDDGSYDPNAPNIVTGVVDGDKEVAVASYREVGIVKEQMQLVNEDCVGFSSNKVVVADGMGAHLHSKEMARYATEELLRQSGSLYGAIRLTRSKVEKWLEFYRQNLFNPEYEAMTKAVNKRCGVPDIVMVALHFDGDYLERMLLGDSIVYLVRGEKVYKSIEYNVLYESTRTRKKSRRQAIEDGDGNTITVDLIQDFHPIVRADRLQRGDRLVLMSDGMKMLKAEIYRAVAGKTPQEGVNNLLMAKYHENNAGGGIYYPGDALGPMLVHSKDNGTVAVVAYH